MIKQQPFVNENIYVKIYLIREKTFLKRINFTEHPHGLYLNFWWHTLQNKQKKEDLTDWME